ncbi:hypothetical protein [Nocardia stercoris]|uniref:hypothetical protein n=1 Tax=Nocardia stercoris TaxID=2483361 RepID=UPI0011C3C65B|nr:hypothetical protein [Nocardia stercoris]
MKPDNIASIRQPGRDTELAPLGIPAIVVGIGMLVACLATLPRLHSWIESYGSMVSVAFVVLVVLAAGFCRWGWIVARSPK